MDVTPRKRAKVLALHQHTKKSQREIANCVGVSQPTVHRLIKKFQIEKDLTPNRKGNCGRKKKTTPRTDAYLLRESKLNPRKTSFELQKDLVSAGTVVDSSTVRRRLLAVGRRARRPIKKQLLTSKMKQKRLIWAKKYQDWTCEQWRQVLFSDESHFLVQGVRSQHVRRSKGEPLKESHIDQTVKHPLKKMFWGCFSYYGVGPLKPVEGMMNSEKYLDVLKQKVIPEIAKKFPEGSGIFQQDLAPCHTSRKVKNFFSSNNILVLDWPGNSPDLNPIENLWSIIKLRPRKRDCTTMVKLIEAIIDCWFRDPQIQENCKKLIDSMPKRVKSVLTSRGGHIRY